MFNEYDFPVLLNALDEYAKIAKNVPADHIERIKSKLVGFMDGDAIASVWMVEDVFSLMFPDEDGNRGHTEAEVAKARLVLQAADENHDATLGINWDTLQENLNMVEEEENAIAE